MTLADLRHAIDVYRAFLHSGGTFSVREFHECVIVDAEHVFARASGSTAPALPPSHHCKNSVCKALAEVYSELAVCCMASVEGCLRPLPARRKAAALLGIDLKTFSARRRAGR